MMEFDWDQEAHKRLHHLENENADLRRENARLREYLKELELETVRISLYRNRFKRAARALTVH
jgi:regulator of replication initiation timing